MASISCSTAAVRGHIGVSQRPVSQHALHGCGIRHCHALLPNTCPGQRKAIESEKKYSKERFYSTRITQCEVSVCWGGPFASLLSGKCQTSVRQTYGLRKHGHCTTDLHYDKLKNTTHVTHLLESCLDSLNSLRLGALEPEKT